jgi:hypothetical protein
MGVDRVVMELQTCRREEEEREEKERKEGRVREREKKM